MFCCQTIFERKPRMSTALYQSLVATKSGNTEARDYRAECIRRYRNQFGRKAAFRKYQTFRGVCRELAANIALENAMANAWLR
jgi:hypothetical protein